mmetsp:Transcript_1384/g.3743  ORF Transcript_1384/g.3743 Transcript_1384/m.3743 type:complete len:201 (+) Transcript_1384:694-1296(+)
MLSLEARRQQSCVVQNPLHAASSHVAIDHQDVMEAALRQRQDSHATAVRLSTINMLIRAIVEMTCPAFAAIADIHPERLVADVRDAPLQLMRPNIPLHRQWFGHIDEESSIGQDGHKVEHQNTIGAVAESGTTERASTMCNQCSLQWQLTGQDAVLPKPMLLCALEKDTSMRASIDVTYGSCMGKWICCCSWQCHANWGS